MRGVAPKASIPRGLLRFALLLVAACLIGALVGILTEPFAKSSAESSTAHANEPSSSTATRPSDGQEKAVSKEAATPTTDPSQSKDPPAGSTRGFLAGKESTPNALAKALAPDFTGLAIVGGILGVFTLVAFFLSARTRQRRISNGVVHLVDSLPIAPGRSVHLVRCEGRKFLIGNSERGIHFLASLPQNEVERALDAVVDDTAATAAEGEPSFESLLAGSSHR